MFCHTVIRCILLVSQVVASSRKVEPLVQALVDAPVVANHIACIASTLEGRELPVECLAAFASQKMEQISRLSDTFGQRRLVKLLCALMERILKREPLALLQIGTELEEFCLRFSSLERASALYRLAMPLLDGG